MMYLYYIFRYMLPYYNMLYIYNIFSIIIDLIINLYTHILYCIIILKYCHKITFEMI